MGDMGIAVFWSKDMSVEKQTCISRYIQLCSSMCKVAQDYTKEKVKKHNTAMKNLSKLKEDICVDRELMLAVYDALLNNSDDYVRQAAATDCLEYKIFEIRSVNILKQICKNKNQMMAMGAKRTLLIWKGKISPKDPF